VTDENPRTFWVAQQNKPGEWVTIDLQKEHEVKALQVNYTDYKSDIFDNDPARVYTQFKVYHSLNGKQWKMMVDLTNQKKRDRPNAYVELDNPVRTRFIKYEHGFVASPNLAISDIRIFGNGYGGLPKTPAKFTAKRDVDARNAFITWEKVAGAVGYNILWGIAKDKLYQTYQLFADQPTSLEIRALSKEVEYYFAIEAFNENGVSKVGEVIYLK
jgi:xylan 1,4-beta-xylosidase